MRIIDPPSGWMYGFPAAYDRDPAKETVEEWFLRKGYPQQLIDQGALKHCRSWTMADDGEEELVL